MDTGCIVAFQPTVAYDIQFVGGIKSALFGGLKPETYAALAKIARLQKLEDGDTVLVKGSRGVGLELVAETLGEYGDDRVTLANELMRHGQLESVDGLGYLAYQSITHKDFPVTQAVLLFVVVTIGVPVAGASGSIAASALLTRSVRW